MQMSNDIRDAIRRHAEVYPLETLNKIDKKIVHKFKESNVLISGVSDFRNEEKDVFVGQCFIDPSHAFFFEHPNDHVPGMMIIEAGRQCAMAIAHQFYNVSFDTAFIVHQMENRFLGFIELNAPIYMYSSICDKVMRKDVLRGMHQKGCFVQNEKIVAEMNGQWQFFDKRIYEKLRKSSASKASVASAKECAH